MGLLKGVVSIVGLLLLALIGLAAFLYFTDYAVEGTITEKRTEGGATIITIRPALLPYDVQQPVDANAAQFVCTGYKVSYHIQTERYEVRDREGRVVYDSESGLTSLFSPARCALLG